MSQTREERMHKHYQSLIRRYGPRGDSDHLTEEERNDVINTNVWLVLARTWKMPVTEVKGIVKEYQREQGYIRP